MAEPGPQKLAPVVLVALSHGSFGVPMPLGGLLECDLPLLRVLADISRHEDGVALETLDLDTYVAGTTLSATDLQSSIDRLIRQHRIIPADTLVTTPQSIKVGDGAPTEAPPAADFAGSVMVSTPLTARPVDGQYEIVGHYGSSLEMLTTAEFFALRSATRPTLVGIAHEQHVAEAGEHALDIDQYLSLLGRIHRIGFLVGMIGENPDDAQFYGDGGIIDSEMVERDQLLRETFTRRALEHDAAEAEHLATTGTRLTRVIPVAFDPCPPLALGLIAANASVHNDGALLNTYSFRREFVYLEDREQQNTEHPAVYLFSNYLWSHEHCIEVSKRVKAASPGSVTVHGGPDTPSYDVDALKYFETHPHIDVTVRGEGEATATDMLEALATVVGDERPDLSVLDQVPGLFYRNLDGEVIKTANRDRIVDLDAVPSPFLEGFFDAYAEVPGAHVTTETNRGCPYGCTFCDWGSATMSRIRKFSIERVFAELEWCAAAQVTAIGPADSNFGIFKRDVEIAQKVADLKNEFGSPEVFGVSYAKNTVKHLQRIIEILAEAGIFTQGIMSLQTMDDDVLDTIRRHNIKTSKYDQLAAEFRRSDLPLFVDLMLGLPGSSSQTFINDLQACLDREVQVRIPQTTLLVNSPMNDPEYKAEHQIETNKEIGPGRVPLVVSTATFTKSDYEDMRRLREIFLLFENFGVLRQVSRFVRQETGMLEVDLYEQIRKKSRREPNRLPMLSHLVWTVPNIMAAPLSWKWVLDDVRTFILENTTLEPSAAFDAVLDVQLALLPAFDRPRGPVELHLKHDVAAWFNDIIAAKEAGERTAWPEVVAPLHEYGPATFAFSDPHDVVRRSLGCNLEMHGFGLNWEFDSKIRRAFGARDRQHHNETTSQTL